jgi:inorganic pyrophosphatase
MPIRALLENSKKFEIERYQKPKDSKKLAATHAPYSGSPFNHPHDPEKMVLVVDPYFTSTFYYEFKKADISFVEELQNLVNVNGDVFVMARIWVKKMSLAVRCIPFIAGDIED